MNKTAKVYASKKKDKKTKKVYENYLVKIPMEVADTFCLNQGQELILNYDILSKSITLNLKPKDFPDHETWAKRMMKKDLRRDKKTDKKKIVSNEVTRIHKWISYIQERNNKLKEEENVPKDEIKRNNKLIRMHKERIAKLNQFSS